MQAEDECSSGMAGNIEEQGAKDGEPVSPDNPKGQDGAGGSDGQGGPGSRDCQSIPSDSEGQVGPSGPDNPCGPSGEGAVGDAARGDPAVAQAPPAPGPGGEAAPGTGEPGGRPLTFTLLVPFQNPLEAEMARRCLISDVQHQGPVVRKEFTVSGSILAVRWTAAELGALRSSVNNFLTHLSLVVRNIQCIGHPFQRNLGWEK